jgi:osmotically-inducible protein OsmY
LKKVKFSSIWRVHLVERRQRINKNSKLIMMQSKRRNQSTRNMLFVALPLFLFLAGCNQKPDASGDAAPPANRDANADNSMKKQRVATTQRIRKMIASGQNDYSTAAKNIKIITAGGKVTLRGPVNTPAEKAGIEAAAKSVAGESNVDDQLELKSNQ